MLSQVEIERAARILGTRLRGHKLQRVVQPDASQIVLETFGGAADDDGPRDRAFVALSCDPESARVSLRDKLPRALPQPPAFAQYLRAHVMRARVDGVRIVDEDRQLAIRLRHRDGDFDLLLALFGRRTNILLLDADAKILVAMRPLPETRSELQLGGRWQSPASRPPTAGTDRFADVRDEDFLRAVEARYSAQETEGAADALRRRLGRALRKEARSLDRKLEKLGRELGDAERAVHLEREGELLKSVLSKVKRGDTEALAHDFATGEEVRVALDPKKSPAENLERIFKRYQKAVRSLTKAGAQRDAVQAARDEIAAFQSELDAAAGGGADADGIEGDRASTSDLEVLEVLEVLEALAARPPVHKLLAKHAPAERPRPQAPGRDREMELAGRKVPAKFVPRRYATDSGLEIWVGRSDAANDYLSTRLARGKDLFFHLDGAPGSHVILRTEGRKEVPNEAVLDACELAIHFSRAKNATRADVHVVPIANVKKPKGAKPGLVMVHGGRTVHLRRTPARLERLLG